MKARCLCPYGDGSPSSHCWCIDMTAAWFHGAAKKPLVVSVNWNRTVYPSFLSLLQLSIVGVILCRFVWICVCVLVYVCVCMSVCVCLCVCVRAKAAAEHTNRQEVLIYLCSVFSHNLSKRVSKSKSEKRGTNLSGFVCHVGLKWKHTVLPQAHSNQRCLSLPGQEKKSTLGWSFILSLSASLFLSQIGAVVFEEIKEDFCLTWTFRN